MTHCNRLFSHLVLGLSLAGGLVASAPAAGAQSRTPLKVTIPFSFSANRQPLPPGTYTVEIAQERFLCFHDTKTGKSQFVMVRPDAWTRNGGGSRLVFHRESGQTYLTQVWVAGTNLHSELLSHPKPNRELAKLAPPASSFEIAMN